MFKRVHDLNRHVAGHVKEQVRCGHCKSKLFKNGRDDKFPDHIRKCHPQLSIEKKMMCSLGECYIRGEYLGSLFANDEYWKAHVEAEHGWGTSYRNTPLSSSKSGLCKFFETNNHHRLQGLLNMGTSNVPTELKCKSKNITWP